MPSLKLTQKQKNLLQRLARGERAMTERGAIVTEGRYRLGSDERVCPSF